jgi:arylsulfatase A-like enzyme
VLLIALTIGSIAAPRPAFAADDKRLNILFCFADDWGRYMSAYAAVDGRPTPNDVVKTPNLDRLAREGVLFRNAFVGSPSCTPCRSALVSGQYFFRTGRAAILSGAVWDMNIPAFPLLVHDAGYHIGETGKVWSPGTPNDGPFGGGKYAYEKEGLGFNNYSEAATAKVSKGDTPEQARDELLAQTKANFDDFLAANKEGKPWLYWYGATNVHRKWQLGSGRALYGINPDDLKGKLPPFLPDVPEVREDFADYLGEIQFWDAEVGTLVKRLEEAGQLDNTVIVVSGDHGAPGFTHGKCNLYDFGVAVALVARVPGGKPGRVVDDFVHLMDLAPTYCEIAGVTPPAVMTGRSIWNILKSDAAGQIDPSRTWVVTGRERHVNVAREGNLPYPHRALRTPEFLYIRNFKPDRWPMGDPKTLTDSASPSHDDLVNETYAAFADMDSSPTKAWLIEHRNDAQYRKYFDYAFAKRPAEELYDLRKDPDQIMNVADDPAYSSQKQELGDRLMKVLVDAGDPRVTGDGTTFDNPPFTTVEGKNGPAKKKKAKN